MYHVRGLEDSILLWCQFSNWSIDQLEYQLCSLQTFYTATVIKIV